jgi:3-hydroxyisobutyrate dehydrogenase-like beta-hydroxyacid dehydrogenase
MVDKPIIGFIGLGVMGEPMCRHLITKSGFPVVIFDLVPEPVGRLAEIGATSARSVAAVALAADVIFVSLPSGKHLQALCEGSQGLIACIRPGQTVVDLGTSPLQLSKELAATFMAKGVAYADAPVARTRQAAEQGTLAVTVGASASTFDRIESLLRCFASEVTHCGDVGSGQVVKIMNNMVLVGTVTALCEAAEIARSTGIDTKFLFDAFSKGSADSFALRNHGLKSVAAREFPKRAFSAEYMLKDISYALAIAQDAGILADGAKHSQDLLKRAIEYGLGAEYWPVILRVIDGSASSPSILRSAMEPVEP